MSNEQKQAAASENKMMSFRVRKVGGQYDDKEVAVYVNVVHDPVASQAIAFIERWGMVAAMEDGEDSHGRAKLRLATPDEVVERAFTIAEKAFATAVARNHTVVLPDLNAINAEGDAKKATADQARQS